jgi:anti-sigma-K factor RskA
MGKIEKDRLIELAEGRLTSPAEEQKLLDSSPELREEIEALRALFAELKQMPQPEPDAAALAAMSKTIRESIERQRTRPLLQWSAHPLLSSAFAAAASLVIAVGLYFAMVPGEAPESSPTVAEEAMAYDIETDYAEALSEASAIEDFELYEYDTESLDSESVDLFLSESTDLLIESASSLENEQFAELAETLGLDEI